MQTVLADQSLVSGAEAWISRFLGLPASQFGTFASGGDVSAWFTRLFQLGALGSLLQFLGITGFIQWAYYSLHEYIISRFVLDVYLSGDEVPCLWLMLWLSKQKSWDTVRSIQVSSHNFGLGTMLGTLVPGEDTTGKEGQSSLTMLPSDTFTVWYKRRIIRVARLRTYNKVGREDSALSLTIYSRKRQILYDLLLEAKKLHEAECISRVIVYSLDQWNNNWQFLGSRPKRSMQSVIIPEETKKLLLEDAKDFMDSEEWYSQRGIPWQRGWLLYGAPGSGKTSTIQALAGELDLPIYVVSLSKRGLDDTSLNTLINSIPPKSMILMEDIDAAFTRSVTREPPPESAYNAGRSPMPGMPPPPSAVTLSGLLNAIDGVQAQQGRLLFATTNKYRALDPALVRPGRLDLHIEFILASKWQARELFKRFYPLEKTERAAAGSTAGTRDEHVTLDPKIDVPMSEDPSHPSETGTKEAAADESIKSSPIATEDPSSVQRIPTAGPLPNQRGRKAPRLTFHELEDMSQRFADAIPEGELSMAQIQGHLMMYKTSPHDAILTAPRFVAYERERRESQESEAAEAKMNTLQTAKEHSEQANQLVHGLSVPPNENFALSG